MHKVTNVHYIRKENLADGSLQAIYDGVFAIGNFDGVHKGHLAVLKKTFELSRKVGTDNNWGVIMFNPHPQEFLFHTEKCLLMDIEMKILTLKKIGVPKILILEFQDFFQLKGEDFLNKVLLQGLRVKGIVVGEDFKYASNREGTIELLKHFTTANNIKLAVLSKLKIDDVVCSSSNIRQLILEGKIEEANLLLSDQFQIQSEVIQGQCVARTLGYPTANMILANNILEPKYGVYLVMSKVMIDNTEYMPGIANFGLKPTVQGGGSHKFPILEVHILNYNANLYNKNMLVKFIKFIRSEQKFASLEELKSQLGRDVKYATRYFANNEGIINDKRSVKNNS